MGRRYPRLRRYARNGRLTLREGLLACFFMRRSHQELGTTVARYLSTYRQAIEPGRLGWYVDMEGAMRPLDEEGWAYVRSCLLESPGCNLILEEHPNQVGAFRFEYRGKQLDSFPFAGNPDEVSEVSFWLPVEYLEERGPGAVRELVMELARELPFNSGYVSLAFNHLGVLGVERIVRELCFRYPGLDVHHLSDTSQSVGTRARGAYWLNFYGQPLVSQLGGAETLRARLTLPEVSIQEMERDRLMVSLGEWPEVGDAEEPRSYRALARVLEPYLSEEPIRWHSFTAEDMRRWQCRFLD
jgi:hypothetical protein